MGTQERTKVTVEATILAPVNKVWRFWTDPVHITGWNNASEDWHTVKAENDLKPGGRFLSRMEAKDGSTGFDFSGEYTEVDHHNKIEYIMDDGREVQVTFISEGDVTTVTETFDAEKINPVFAQKEGWQAILDNFKRFAEDSGKKETLLFELTINAPKDKVYKTMLDKNHYMEWTSEFNAGSHFEGTWEPGSKMLFIGVDKDGNKEGMIGTVRENIAFEFVSIEYIGIYRNGKEITGGPEAEEWSGLENYRFTSNNGNTLLSVRLDTNKEFLQYFKETYPRALKRLKEICEKK